MPKLYRPTIPIEVKCRVALAQLGEMWPDKVIDAWRPKPNASYMAKVGLRWNSLGRLLETSLDRLAELLGCDVSDLRLDHDPPLAARPQFRRGLGRKIYYEPPANSVDHLRYRPHGPQFNGSHLIKTNVRGDHGQFPDRVLIKRERKRLRDAEGNQGRKAKRSVNRPKTKWPKRKMRSASRWPKRKMEVRP